MPQLSCRIAAKHPRHPAYRPKIDLAKTATPSLSPLQRVSNGLLRQPAHHSHNPRSQQIAIVGNHHADYRGFLPWRLSDAGP